MSDGMLSQEEINALLGGIDLEETDENNENSNESSNENSNESSNDVHTSLTNDEIDALGEIGNISMGTAATTLFTLLNHKVLITTPKVEVITWEQFTDLFTDDLIGVVVDYTEGFIGSNLLILKEKDVKVITDLMMGGSGEFASGPITDLHLSAISEAMNQMIGSSSTSMSQIFNKKIDISTPQAVNIDENLEKILGSQGELVKISFRLQIEDDIIDSELMQVLPINFAKDLINNLFESEMSGESPMMQQEASAPEPTPTPQMAPTMEAPPMQQQMPQQQIPQQQMPPQQPNVMPNYGMGMPYYGDPNMMQGQSPFYGNPNMIPMNNSQMQQGYQGGGEPVDVKMPQFQSFDQSQKVYPKENMDILMDVSLEVSVELGRTSRKIKEILEFGPGSIIELDRLVGEPIDVLVNGKFVAKGEVVVIDENFGIRITDIINPENRI